MDQFIRNYLIIDYLISEYAWTVVTVSENMGDKEEKTLFTPDEPKKRDKNNPVQSTSKGVEKQEV